MQVFVKFLLIYRLPFNFGYNFLIYWSIFFSIYLFIWLCWVLVVACRFLSCGMRTLICGMHVGSISLIRDRTGPPALGVHSLIHCTTREVLEVFVFYFLSCRRFTIFPGYQSFVRYRFCKYLKYFFRNCGLYIYFLNGILY